MKKGFKKFLAKTVAVAMLMGTVTGIGVVPEKAVNAAQISEFKNVEFGIKYSGQVKTVESESGSAWSAEYFNVKDSAFETGDTFYVSAKISGASNFKQVAVQSNVNGWDWAGAPKKWTEAGTADGTVVSGLITATTEEEKISFKIQLDNAVAAVSSPVNIDLTDLYIMKVSKGNAAAKDLPEDKQLDMGTRYTGQVDAVAKNGVYEAQYFNVNNSSYSADDTYIISYKISGANGFKQVATQTNLNDWGWTDAKKSWNEEGISDGLDMSGDFVAASSGNGISFKVRLDTLKDAAEEPDGNVTLTLTDLIVVKVTNSDSIELPKSKLLSKGRSYTGSVDAVMKDGNKWVAEYFNLENSAFEEGDQVKISFKVSGASAFKQLAVQSSFDNWAWDSAPKIWRNDGIADGTELSAVMTATCDEDNLSFKLWFDNPVAADFEDASVEVTVTDLMIKDIVKVDSLQKAYKGLFDVGAAVSAKMVGDVEYQNRIKGVFGTITAENEMKPDALLNQEASQAAEDGMPVLNLEYSGMSKILDFAKENDLKVRGHALVYAKQTPDWFFREGYEDSENYVDADVMEARMESYISQVMNFVKENYPGVVTSWDVVNEALNDNGSYVQNKWYDIMRGSYVTQAFTYANAYAEPTAKLYYNDYNMDKPEKYNRITIIAGNLEGKIDGIGIQGHVTKDEPSVSEIEEAIDYFAKAGLDVQITELDVEMQANQSLADQAERYKELFTLFKDKSESISNVTLWGINDGNSWRSAGCPLLFFDDLTPKPAFASVLGVVKS